MKLLILYNNYYIELNWNGKLNQDYILSIGNINKIFINLILFLLYKEIKAVISSKEIIIKGIIMNAIKTIEIYNK